MTVPIREVRPELPSLSVGAGSRCGVVEIQFFIDRPNLPEVRPAETYAPVDTSHPTDITVKDLDSDARLSQLVGHAVRLTDKQVKDLAFPVWNASQRGASGTAPARRFSVVGVRRRILWCSAWRSTGRSS